MIQIKPEIKKFLTDNKELIKGNQWENFYKSLNDEKFNLTGNVTELLHNGGIHPEYFMTYLPEKFMEYNTPITYNVPDHITNLGYHSLAYCWNLKKVTIGNKVKTIEEGAFMACKNLTTIVWGESVKVIGSYAFASCNDLESIVIPDTVGVIGKGAFKWCHKLSNITFGNNIHSIGKEAFFALHYNIQITFKGSKEQWKTLAKGQFNGVTYTCTCNDGIIKKSR